MDLIAEDDEDSSPAKPTMGQSRLGTESPVTTSPRFLRNRSSSASHPPSAARGIVKKSSRPDVNAPTPSPPFARERRPSQTADTFPLRNRKAMPVSSNTIDFDDAVKTSDDEDAQFGKKKTHTSQPRTPLAVSAKNQDLINFLSDGPPDPRVSCPASTICFSAHLCLRSTSVRSHWRAANPEGQAACNG